jgi:hypothetical protein
MLDNERSLSSYIGGEKLRSENDDEKETIREGNKGLSPTDLSGCAESVGKELR